MAGIRTFEFPVFLRFEMPGRLCEDGSGAATLKIASWNVNSIRARVGHVTGWLRAREPDVLMLQELKG